MPQKRGFKEKFEPKELVLAKMHGFPAWPSFVMPLNLVPEAILKAKKKTTNFCVIFIPDGDFYWMNEKSLDTLTTELLEKKIEKIPAKHQRKKSAGRTLHVNDALLAAQGLDFDDFMKQLDTEAQDGEEDEEEDEEEEEADGDDEDSAVNADASTEGTNGVKTEEEVEEEEEEELSSRSARMKRRATTSPPAKRAKTHTHTPPPHLSNGGAKKKQGSATSPSSIKATTDEERQHQLWLCRIKLQRTLIQRNQPVTPTDPNQFPPPTSEELLVAKLILHKLADFPMNVDFLKSTKIHKVLKCILRNRDLEYSESYKLHEKCDGLLHKWSKVIDELRLDKLKEEKKSPDDSEISGIEASISEKSTNGNGESVDVHT